MKLFVIALAVRLLFVWEVHDSPVFTMLFVDSASYDKWAKAIASGDWMGNGVFYQAPLYPYFLGIVYRLFSPSILPTALIQSLLGATSCVLLAAAGTRLFGMPAGLISGLLLAFYPTALFSEIQIQKSSLDIFLTTLLLYLLCRTHDSSSRRLWMILGMVLGCLTLNRENAASLVPVVLIWTISRSWGHGLKETGFRAALFTLGLALLLLPVGLRNLMMGGEFHLTTSQFGPNLYIGNNPNANGIYVPLVPGRDQVEHERSDATSLAERMTGKRLSQREVSRYWTGRALRFVSDTPLSWLRLMGRKTLILINRVEVADSYDQYSYDRWSVILRVLNPVFNFGLLVPLAALGVVLTWPLKNRLWPLYAITITYAASVLAFYIFARYRIPLIPLLILFASAGLVRVREAFSMPRPGLLFVAAGTAISAAILANWPVIPDQIPLARHTMSANIGSALMKEGKQEEALTYLADAIRYFPAGATANSQMGVNLILLGRPAEALQYMTTALRSSPASPEFNMLMGYNLVKLARPEEAISYFKAALLYDPQLAMAHDMWAEALETMGRQAEALDHVRAGRMLKERLAGRQ